MKEFSVTTNSVEETASLAQAVALNLRGGEDIELLSDVGGGKTMFVKGLAKGMGITETVQSPTFTISQIYEAPNGLELHHFDFYRLSEPGVMRAELAESVASERAVVVVEWAEIVADVLPEDRLRVTIKSTGDNSRQFTFACSPQMEYLLKGIA